MRKMSKNWFVKLFAIIIISSLQVNLVSAAELLDEGILSEEASLVESNAIADELQEDVNNLEENVDNSIEIEEKLTTDPKLFFDEDDNVNIVTASNIVTFEDQFQNNSEIKRFAVDVDYSTLSVATLSLIRKGLVNASITIYDSNNTKLTKLSTGKYYAKEWIDLPKVGEDTIQRYYLDVSTNDYKSGQNSTFRINIGNKNNSELLVSGMDNAADLDMYYEANSNYQQGSYLPNQYENWYRITNSTRNILTILLKTNDIRFKVYDASGNNTLLDSNNDASIHRTQNVGRAWACAEKMDLSTVLNGSTYYYIAIYNLSPTNSYEILEGNYLIAYGNPMLFSGHTTINPSRTISINTRNYTEMSFTVSADSLPRTACVTQISYSGTAGAYISSWRVMPPRAFTWNTSSSFSSGINIPFTKDSQNNTSAIGTWRAGFLAASSSNGKRITPNYRISYYYEIGD